MVMRRRNARLRKKLRLGEFQQLGFEVSIALNPELGIDAFDRFLDEFIVDVIEANNLVFGGGVDSGFITSFKYIFVSEAHRTIVENWLKERQEVISVTLGPLVDALYGGAPNGENTPR